MISFAGKVSLEVAYPCLRIPWKYGRDNCRETSELEIGPPGNISTLAALQPFLNRYMYSYIQDFSKNQLNEYMTHAQKRKRPITM